MRDTKQTGLNLVFISAVHAPVHTCLTAYTTIHGPHLSPTFFSLSNCNPHLLYIRNVFSQRHSVEHILWCYHLTFPNKCFSLHKCKKACENTCNDAILSWADPRTPLHATFWFLCEKDILFVSWGTRIARCTLTCNTSVINMLYLWIIYINYVGNA
jgi:hypothetical protein